MSRRSTRNNLTTAEMLGTPSMPTHVMPSVSAMGALPKAPKPPEKPLIPYMRYSRKVWDEVKTNNPDLKLWEIGKIIGQQWRELPSIEKQPYIDEYEVEKIDHLEQLKQYHNSPAYQAYLHAKARVEAMEAAEALVDKDDAYMSIEPTDDNADDSDMSCSVKHVAAARFQRNHRLINDILGESNPVPSFRSIITTHRLGILKNQVHSLEMHRKKLEADLVNLEDSFQAKKRKMISQSDDFEKEMNRLASITPQEYYQEHKLKHKQAIPPPQEKTTDEGQKKGEVAQAPNDSNDTSTQDSAEEQMAVDEKAEVTSDQPEIAKPSADTTDEQPKDTEIVAGSGDTNEEVKTQSSETCSDSNTDAEGPEKSNDAKDDGEEEK